MVNKLRIECLQLSGQLKIPSNTVATQCATKDINNENLTKFQSEVGYINNSIVGCISHYKL